MNLYKFFPLILLIPKLSVLSGTNVTRIIPEPYETQLFNGFWKIPDNLGICVSNDVPSAETVSAYFQNVFKQHTGKQYKVGTCPSQSNEYQVQIFYDQNIVNEGYNLSVDKNGVIVKSSSVSGFFYASESIDQLIDKDLSISYLNINDRPRFSYRGLLLDVSRHFFDVPTIKFILSQMAHYKLNKLHWHLTDDQGWRLEIKKYPKLTEIGSKRAASPVIFDRGKLDNKPYGPFFYTQEEVKEIVQYAKRLHIQVIPEIEIPGHSKASLSAYPQYSCTGGPFEPRCYWGIEEDVYCAGNDETIHFLEDILNETMELFESDYIHIGGDEVLKDRWKNCEKCQKRIKEKNLKDENELQSWVTEHFVNYLSKNGKRAICWDDVVQDKRISNNTIFMIWHDTSVALQAVNQGNQVILSPQSCYYFDYAQNSKDQYEYIGGLSTLKNVYSHNPTNKFPKEKEKFILGTQANLWTEHIHTKDELTWKIFPRLCAFSESAWTPNEKKSWDIFSKKLKYKHIEKLKKEGNNVAPTDLLPVAEWKCNGTETWEEKNWTVSSNCPCSGKFSIDFTFLDGGRTQIKDIQIINNNNQIVGVDLHLSFIGPKNNNTQNYQIVVENLIYRSNVLLNGKIKCKTPSEGQIFMDFAYDVPERLDPDVIF